MGQKIHPDSIRLILTKNWNSKWFASKKDFADFLIEDINIRKAILNQYGSNSGIAKIIVERSPQELTLNIHTSKPGVLIGRQGKGINDLKALLAKINKLKIRLNIIEIKNPDMIAQLVAANIGQQITKRISYRRAIKQAIEKTMQAGAKGVKIMASGRLSGAEIARKELMSQGTIPSSNLKKNIDFAIFHTKTTYGIIGIKVWINKGDLDLTTIHETIPSRQII